MTLPFTAHLQLFVRAFNEIPEVKPSGYISYVTVLPGEIQVNKYIKGQAVITCSLCFVTMKDPCLPQKCARVF